MLNRKIKYYIQSVARHDLKASITVFFVALPLCLGVALASNTPANAGLMAGIIGGLVVPLISKSQLSVSGPAAGLTAISVVAISQLGSPAAFFLAVAIAGLLQMILGIFKLGGFTSFIPSSVIKGMLAAIGIILISKQVPILIGYDQPDFWRDELFNIITFNHGFQHINNLYNHTSAGAISIGLISLLILASWKKYVAHRIQFVPVSFVAVLIAVMLARMINDIPLLKLKPTQFVSVPDQLFTSFSLPDPALIFSGTGIWQTAVIICVVASLETLLSIEAIDKLDPYNRVTPHNRELVAQGTGNFLSGLLGGIPVTAVIVRSSANAEAGAKTKLSAFAHGIWLVAAVLIAVPLLNMIPYCVLAAILIRTGYNLAKPRMIRAVFKQGREQFFPFIVTVIAVLFTDLVIGVIVGIIYSIYFLVKHTYRAGFIVTESPEGHNKKFIIDLALNVTFLNKKRFVELLDKIPRYSVVEINGSKSVYIDRDILEIFQDFKVKARNKHIELTLINIPEVETIEIHQ